jgi:hypothetical protein
MFGLLKRPIEREEVASEIAEISLDRLIEKINKLLKAQSNRAMSQWLFVYVIVIFWIQTSSLGYNDKHRLCMTLTGIWSNKLPWTNNDKPASLPIIFLHERLKEYRSMQHPQKLFVDIWNTWYK